MNKQLSLLILSCFFMTSSISLAGKKGCCCFGSKKQDQEESSSVSTPNTQGNTQSSYADSPRKMSKNPSNAQPISETLDSKSYSVFEKINELNEHPTVTDEQPTGGYNKGLFDDFDDTIKYGQQNEHGITHFSKNQSDVEKRRKKLRTTKSESQIVRETMDLDPQDALALTEEEERNRQLQMKHHIHQQKQQELNTNTGQAKEVERARSNTISVTD